MGVLFAFIIAIIFCIIIIATCDYISQRKSILEPTKKLLKFLRIKCTDKKLAEWISFLLLGGFAVLLFVFF